MEKKNYPGTISSVILSVFVVILVLLPFATANYMEKVRNGNGKYEFKETMFWDLNSNDDFYITKYIHYSDTGILRGLYPWGYKLATYTSPYESEDIGSGMFWRYKSYNSAISEYQNSEYGLETSFIDLDFPNSENLVVDKYSLAQFTDNTVFKSVINTHYTATPNVKHRSEIFEIYVDLDSEWIENDATILSFYLDVDATKGTTYYFINFQPMEDEDSDPQTYGDYYRFASGIYEFGTRKNISIDINDLIELQLLNSLYDELSLYIGFNLIDLEEEYITDSVIIFDVQVYGILEIKIPSVDWISMAMVGGGVFMIFSSILMLPYVTFSGVIGRIVGK